MILLPLLMISCAEHKKSQWTVTGPDGKISMTFRLQEGQPLYSVSYEGRPVVLPSAMGLVFSDSGAFSGRFDVVSVDTSETHTSWSPVYGNRSKIADHYRSMTVQLKDRSGGGALGLEFRVFDGGAAFRYIFLSDDGSPKRGVLAERTAFVLPGNDSCFAAVSPGFGSSYETTYDPLLLDALAADKMYYMPFLVHQQGQWVMLTEAALDNYSGIVLKKGDQPHTLQAVLSPYPGKECRVCPPLPDHSPWRVFLIAPRAGDMIGQTVVLNLNEPRKIRDVSWIQPGKATWPWWNGRITEKGIRSGVPSTAVMKYYTDFAARHKIPYLVVDAGWYSLEMDAWNQPEKEDVLTMEETRRDFYDIRQVLDHANSKGVKVFLWVHYSSMKDRIDTVLATYARWGAAGIKLDNYGGEDQLLVNTLHRIIRTAARYHLLVDYHGAYKPTGYTRTWPNFMTCEAVRGMEYAKGSKNNLTLTHMVTIPYTRMVPGPMDLTPGVFDLDGTKEFPEAVPGTRARQIAMHVVYYSPIQMLPDYPRAYEAAPQQFDFLMKIPVTWDETRFLQGYPGRDIALARRKGNAWWIGLMTGNDPRTMTVNLSLLEEGKKYRAVILQDGGQAEQDPQDVKITEKEVRKGEVLKIRLAAGGGAAVCLTPEP